MTLNRRMRPPASENSRNFTAALARFGPPQPAMRKYIGMSVASKKR